MTSRLVPMRWPTDLLEKVDVAAKAAKMDRTEWVRRAVERELGVGERTPARAPRARRDDDAPDHVCPHPANRRIGTFCAACGRPVR